MVARIEMQTNDTNKRPTEEREEQRKIGRRPEACGQTKKRKEERRRGMEDWNTRK